MAETEATMITIPAVLERNWGTETTVIKTRTHCGKILHRKAGTKGGFQLHVKEESHYLLSGRLRLRRMGAPDVEVKAGASWTVPPMVVHQEEAIEDSVIIEISDPTVDDRYAIEPDPGGLVSMTDADAILKLHKLRDDLRLRADDCDALAKHIWERGLASFA